VKRFLRKKQACLCLTLLLMVLAPCTPAIAAQSAIIRYNDVSPGEAAIVIAAVRVVVDAPPEREASYSAMARRLIAIRAGDRLTDTAVHTAVEALEASHRFSVIDVDMVDESIGNVLVFKLTPYQYIKDIRIRGQYPLFERDILNQMTLYPGDPFTRADLEAQIEAIRNRYQREGYPDPRVTVRAQTDPGEENATVFVTIDKGPHTTLGELTFMGNRGISAGALKRRMKIWRAGIIPAIGRFSEYRLKQDMDTLLKYYRRKGFADAEISFRMDGPDENHRVNVTVQIREGRRYVVKFEGNTHFWGLTLKKDVTLFDDGNRNNMGVRKTIRNMQSRYRAAGYLDARIEAATTDLPGNREDIRQLRFVIQEGPRTIVDTVSITGNHSIPDETIRKQLLTRPPTLFHSGAFVPETLEEDVIAATSLYMQKGFQDRTVDSETTFIDDGTRAAVSLIIDEGPRTEVRSITIEGLTVLPEEAVRKRLVHKIGEPFRMAALGVEKEAITSLIAEQGYPHASVHPDVTYNDDRTRADIVYRIDPGPRVTLGEIFVSGNLKTDEKIIRRELEVRPGEPLSLLTLYDGQRRLRDFNIFHGVSFRTFGLKEKEETVDLFVDVEENKPYYVQVSGGYESDSGFFGRASIGDRNLLGLNKDLWAGGEISQTGYRVETRLTEPRFLTTRTKASIGIFNEKLTEFNQPFGTRVTGGTLGFGHEWGDHVGTSLVFSLERRDQFRNDDYPSAQENKETRTIFVTTPSIRYDSRDSFVRPTKGLYSSLSVDISAGVDKAVDDFVRYLFDTRGYYTPWKGVTLAGLVRVGQVLPYSGSSRVPDDQLFFLGGIRDVRGFKENLLRFDSNGDPVGGKTAIVGSLEARIDLGYNLELTGFLDCGSVQDAPLNEGSDGFRPTAGLGLRYITPIGPMGILYGYKLDRRESESAGRIHVSIGYSF
jgi:outer membrane protein insertion porin family